MIHLLTALGAEATPLVEQFRLQLSPRATGFHVFEGEEARLIVAGVGKVAAAAATAYLHALAGEQGAVWLNVGVVAHRSLPIGEGLVAHEIVEASSGRSWYPQLVVPPPVDTAALVTVDRPIAEPAEGRMYDMEAAGFWPTVMRWSTAEVAASYKVVSDHGVSPQERLPAAGIRDLIGQRAREIIEYARQLDLLLATSTSLPPLDLERVFEKWHFSSTQRHQLSRLARRATALGTRLEDLLPSTAASSRDLMQELNAQLDGLAMESEPR